MSNFKGTKGKWFVTEPIESNGFMYVGEYRGDGSIATCYTVNYDPNKIGKITTETRANAMLISKAPEMLEMLEDILEQIEDGRTYITKEEIKKLIKEATEI